MKTLCFCSIAAFASACALPQTSTDASDAGMGMDAQADSGEVEFDFGGVVTDTSVVPCNENARKALARAQGFSVIWMVDSSSSMADDVPRVTAYINNVMDALRAAGRDYRMVLVTRQTGMTPFISVADWIQRDTTHFRFVPTTESDPLIALEATYDQYGSFLHPTLPVHVVIVSDSNSGTIAGDFLNRYRLRFGRGASFYPNIHAVAAPDCRSDRTACTDTRECIQGQRCTPAGGGSVCVWDGCASPTTTFTCRQPSAPSNAAIQPGTVYRVLTAYRPTPSSPTGGFISFCVDDWSARSEEFGSSEVARLTGFLGVGARVMCGFAIPPPDPGREPDYSRINVQHNPEGGMITPFRNVPSMAQCGSDPAWYFDPEDHRFIWICPSHCAGVYDARGTPEVDILFGCPPRTEIH